MRWDNINPVLVYTLIGAIVFFTLIALFAKGDVDDNEHTNKKESNSH
ncbi:MAG: hypothetical protein QM500_09720 [Methylococcales bacterium]